MDFFTNLAKFFGGLVGDEETKSGVAVHAPESKSNIGVETAAYKDRIPLPFSFVDNNESVRGGIMYVPAHAAHDINPNLEKGDNSEAIQFYNIELDDGTTLDYDAGKDFLNSLTPDRFKIDTGAIRTKEQRDKGLPATEYITGKNKASVRNETFMNNLRKAMRATNNLSSNYLSTPDRASFNRYTFEELNNPNSDWGA